MSGITGVIALRTPCLSYGGDKPVGGSFFDLAADELVRYRENELSSLEVRELVVGNTVSSEPVRSYELWRKVSRHEGLSSALHGASVRGLDASCLAGFSVLDSRSYPKLGSMSVYLGYEDLGVPNLGELARISPLDGYATSGEIGAAVARRYGQRREEAGQYLETSRDRYSQYRAIESYAEQLLPLDTPQKTISYDEEATSTPYTSTSFAPVELARLARGATIIVQTGSLDHVKHLGGLLIGGVGSASGFDDPSAISYIVSAVEQALESAGCELEDMNFAEVFDGVLPVALAVRQTLEIPMDRFNLCGGTLVRGDAISAAGGMLLCNAESLFRGRSDFRRGLLVLYSVPSAVALVVERSVCTE